MQKSKQSHLVRRALVTAVIEAMENNPETRIINAAVLVVDPSDVNAQPFIDVPMDKVNEGGIITLNISLTATGYRSFGETEMNVAIRFNGQERQLSVPYSLIIGLAALSGQNGLLSAENLSAFKPYTPITKVPSANAEMESEEAASSAGGNVVSLFSKKH